MVHHENHSTAKAVVALLIVLIAFTILVLFKLNEANIYMTNSFTPFMTLTVIGMALLVGLLYLVNKPHVTHTKSKATKKKKKK